MIYLISQKYLSETANVSIQANDKNILVAFKAVTEIDVKPLLGIPLYQLLQSKVESETESTFTTEQAELFDLVKYFMSLRVWREMMFDMLNISNKGATESDHQANLDLIKLKRLETEHKAESIRKRILSYLNNNKPAFPQFFPEPQRSASNPDTYNTGIIFDNFSKFYYQ